MNCMIKTFIKDQAMDLNIDLDYTIEAKDDDGFSYELIDEKLVVKANNHRSVLFALYDYSRENKNRSQKIEARFKRRGTIYEVINDIPYLKSQIDLGTQYYHNEIFFTFFLWDEVKESLKEDLLKRDYNVTLGGHSLKFLLSDEIDIDAVDNKNVSIFKDETLQQVIINKVIYYCKDFRNINRISLWPEDLSINKADKDVFMLSYLTFLHKLQTALDQENLSVHVEHIVYNAGLSWEMLEKPTSIHDNKDLNTLYAYWGRDYSVDIQSGEANQLRANQALQDWVKVSKGLCVLEYYSDIFMLSEIYPPLLTRIASDLKFYEKQGAEGLLNLHVPYFTGKHFEKLKTQFDYQKAHQMNSIYVSKLSFDASLSMDFSQADKESLAAFEKALAPLSRFNQMLFPDRITDVNKHTDHALINEIQVSLKTAQKDLEVIAFKDPTLQKDLEMRKEIIQIYAQDWLT